MAKKTVKTTKKIHKKKLVKKTKAKSLQSAVVATKSSKTNVEVSNQVITQAKLSSPLHISKVSAELLYKNYKLFLGLALIYGVLNLVLVQGLSSSSDVTTLKNNLDNTFHGHLSSAGSSFGVFTLLISASGNGSSGTAGAYQVFLVIVSSLAIIWALRQIYAGLNIKIRDSFYRGMYPLIPFMLVLIVIGLQLIPLLIGSTVFSLGLSNGIAITTSEKLLFAAILVITAVISFYFISSSLFALYIVSLPDMTPLKALRSARQLVKGRRLAVFRKVICLPIILFIVASVIMIPIIIWITPAARWIFFLLTMVGLVAIHTYMYTLYRELLNE